MDIALIIIQLLMKHYPVASLLAICQQNPDRPILIPWLSKNNLLNCQPERAKQIKMLARANVEYLAEKIGDGLQDCYWISVGAILDDYFNDEKIEHKDATKDFPDSS